jgi:hypothetical protein
MKTTRKRKAEINLPINNYRDATIEPIGIQPTNIMYIKMKTYDRGVEALNDQCRSTAQLMPPPGIMNKSSIATRAGKSAGRAIKMADGVLKTRSKIGQEEN